MAESATPARRTLYNDPTFSDIKIRHIYNDQVKEYAAHKAILCAHSGWFMAALTGPFMEASTETIEIHEDDPETFQKMMEFFYNMDIKTDSTFSNPNTHLKNHAVPIIALHALADKYDAKALQEAAVVAFKTCTKDMLTIPGFPAVAMLINVHYSGCSGVLGAMSQAIVKYVFRVGSCYLKDGSMNKLVVQHAILGADLYLVGRASSKLVFA